MNLVFFDIECASVNKKTAKICAFGYVVCDENFNIIEKEDILINPRGKFHLTDRKGDKGIVLPYEYADFKNYPPFTQVYPYIKSLLEDDNNVVLGHSTMNDVKYLNLETKRFHLPSFKFSFYDSQLFYMSYVSDYSRQFGLEYIANELGVQFTPHRAADDAYATMRIVESMCRAKGYAFSEFVRFFGMTGGKIRNYTVTPPRSSGEKQYHDVMQKLKRERSKRRTEYFNYISRKKIQKNGKFYGKTFTFSRTIEDDLPLAKSLADKIYAQGGVYSQHITQSDFFIAAADDDSPRTASARKLNSITVTDKEGLEAMLNESSL